MAPERTRPGGASSACLAICRGTITACPSPGRSETSGNGRWPDNLRKSPGDVAEWLRSGLQSRLHRFDSGRRL
jgi:hypothetical protein